MSEIGFGGGCHWCTEAIFQSLKGVVNVQQGWIASDGKANSFSEGVIVHFNPDIISEDTLIAVHLHTHSSTSNHSMRNKYRSAVYTVSDDQAILAKQTIINLKSSFAAPVITTVLPLKEFKLNREEDLNYYYKNPSKPFCKNYIDPKLRLLMERFGTEVTQNRI